MVDYIAMQRQWRGPDWRRRLATEFAGGGNRRVPIDFDAATRRAVGYCQLVAQGEYGRSRALTKYADIASAEATWHDPTLRADVQKLVLANVAVDEICELLGIDASVLQAVEQLYFDVRPMLNLPHWIVRRVIALEADAGRDDLAAEMRLAYFGGSHAAKALLQAKQHLPMERAQQLADASVLLHAKVVQAIDMPLNQEQQMEFLKLAAEIRRQEQLIKLEREKLTFRMQRWTQRCELTRARSSTNDAGYSKTTNEKGAPA